MLRIIKNPNTDADVQLLRTVFPDLLPDGREVTHEQIEAALRESRKSSRYKRTVNKWRRQLFAERRVFLDGQTASGRGFVALTPDEMVRFANRRVREVGRKLRKAIAVASAPNDVELSEDVRRYRGLLEAAMVKMAAENRTTLRDVTRALAPMKQLPQRTAR